MPALVFLGRVWKVASDDFYHPAIIWILFRTLIIISAILLHTYVSYCESSVGPKAYVGGCILLCILFIAVEGSIAKVSSQGTMSNAEIRHFLNYLFYARIVLCVLESIYGTLGVVLGLVQGDCMQSMVVILILAGCLLLDVIVSMFLACVALGRPYGSRNRTASFGDPYGKVPRRLSGETEALLQDVLLDGRGSEGVMSDTDSVTSVQLRQWENSCHTVLRVIQFLTCNLFGGAGTQSDSLQMVAEVMAQFFYGEPDLVISDVMAGFLLLSAVQANEEEEHIEVVVNDKVEEQIEDIAELAKYSKYAIGIYGWMLFIWSRPFSGILQLAAACVLKRSGKTVHGDNWFKFHQLALQLETGCAIQDLVYASFVNRVCQPAFCIILDHKLNSIVVAVRGTLSLEDILTDVIAQGCSTEDAAEEFSFNGDRGVAHQGMLHAALWLCREIQRLQLIEKVMQNEQYRDYQLIVVGHSLGAGTAALLAMMLRPRYPQLHCYAYSSPGCVLSKELADDTVSFVTTCVIGKDLVAVASLESIHELRNNVIDMILRSKLSKHQILQQVISWRSTKELLFTPQQVADGACAPTAFRAHLEQYQEALNRRMERNRQPEMFMPGKVVHIVPDTVPVYRGYWTCCRPGAGVCCTSRQNYHPSKSDASKFRHVRIARTMLDDHFPDKVHCILQEIAKDHDDEVHLNA